MTTFRGKRHLEAIEAFSALKKLISNHTQLQNTHHRKKQNVLRRRGLPTDAMDDSMRDVGAATHMIGGAGVHESFRVDRLRLYLVGYQMRSLKHEKYTKCAGRGSTRRRSARPRKHKRL